MREFFRHITAALFMLALGGLIVACCSCSVSVRLGYQCARSNVVYVSNGFGLAPLLDIDGNPVKCGETGLERKEYQD